MDNEDQSVAPEGGTWKAWYAQASYRIPGTKFEPVLRYGDHKSPHQDQRLKQWGLGLDYWFSASAVAKVGYEINSGEAGTTNDENRLVITSYSIHYTKLYDVLLHEPDPRQRQDRTGPA